MASTNPFQAGQYTPEYLALRKSYRSVLIHITPQTGDVCGALFEKGYIPPTVRNYRATDAIPNDKKAQALLDTVIDKVELDPSVYHGFMDILKSEGQSADTIVEQLEEAFKVEQALVDSDRSSEDSFYSLPDPDPPRPKLSVTTRFICPFCRKCTVKQFFSKAGCPKAGQSDVKRSDFLFPYLDHGALSENERLLVEGRLLDETKKIVCLFADTENSVIISLVAQKVVVNHLKNYVGNFLKLVGSDKDVDRLEKSTDLYDVFFALYPFKSFFNYEIIEKIVLQFGSIEDRRLMEEYISHFNKFCERSVFEVPPNIFHDSETKPGEKVFSVKFTKEGRASLGDVGAVRRKLADILEIEVFALQLCCITDGCVCLKFLVSALSAEKIFSLSQSQMGSLNEIHVRVLEDSVSLLEDKNQLTR